MKPAHMVHSSAAALLSCALLLSACGWMSRSVPILGVTASPDGRTLEIHVASCNAELNAELYEDQRSVMVSVAARNGADADCSDGLIVVLERPLGSRTFIDGHEFTEIEVSRQ